MYKGAGILHVKSGILFRFLGLLFKRLTQTHLGGRPIYTGRKQKRSGAARLTWSNTLSPGPLLQRPFFRFIKTRVCLKNIHQAYSNS